MQASGFAPEDFAHEVFEVWPENWPAWCLYARVSTQWRVGGMGSYIGLDYNPLFILMQAMGLQGDDYLNMFDDIRAIERGALQFFRKE
jgi:hypothetical protein